jgi:hypothetical protein
VVKETYDVLDVLTAVLGLQEVDDLAALGRDGLGANLGGWTLADAVEGESELVFGGLVDLLADLGVVVVEGKVCAERLDELWAELVKRSFASRVDGETYVEVARAAGGGDLASWPVNHAVSCLSPRQFAFGTRVDLQLSVLNSQATSSSATTVDKDPLVALALTRERQGELLVERHAHGDEANASGGSLLEGEVVRDLVGGTLFDDGVLGKAAAVEVVGVGAVCETSDPVAGLVALGAFGADFDDGAAEVAADGRAGGGEVVDVLPELLWAYLFCSMGTLATDQSVGLSATVLTLTRTRSSRSSGRATSWISALPAETILMAFMFDIFVIEWIWYWSCKAGVEWKDVLNKRNVYSTLFLLQATSQQRSVSIED